MKLKATGMVVEPLTIGQMVSAQARLQPDKIAARDLSRAMTYRQLNTRANQLANALVGLGLEAGQRVAVLAYNRVEWAEIYIAVAKAGLVVVPINFRLTAPEAAFIVSHSGAAALIVESALVNIIDSIRNDTDIAASRFIAINSEDKKSPGYRDY